MSDFIIAKVSWLTNLKGSEGYKERYYEYFWQLVKFLQDNSLTNKILLENKGDISPDFSISKSDLTDEGFLVMKNGLDKWTSAVDKGTSPDNISILLKTLEKVRKTV